MRYRTCAAAQAAAQVSTRHEDFPCTPCLDALRLVREAEFVLLDLGLPDLDGLELSTAQALVQRPDRVLHRWHYPVGHARRCCRQPGHGRTTGAMSTTSSRSTPEFGLLELNTTEEILAFGARVTSPYASEPDTRHRDR
ncbi:hypothetical protein [Streptomyces bauhiniae]|uniref:hypothetical protein n=1 Tax=Streptomyces bauhiniae TaxID=2340725 RepID=UPI001EF2EC9A|nr:hypothetical protein [Streptomyces bauhiniae]